MKTTLKQLAPQLLNVVEEAQNILSKHSTPSNNVSPNEKETIIALLEILDNQDLCKAIREVRESEKQDAQPELILEKLWPESSQVTRTKRDPFNNILEVEFRSNAKVYHYFGFQNDMWKKLLACESIGSFINKEIKGKYEYALQGETKEDIRATKVLPTNNIGDL